MDLHQHHHHEQGTRPSCRAWPQAEVEGIVRSSEQPSSFVPANDPASGQWFWIDVPALAAAAGLPPDTPLIEARSSCLTS
jgi:surfeit locus 1 family protein